MLVLLTVILKVSEGVSNAGGLRSIADAYGMTVYKSFLFLGGTTHLFYLYQTSTIRFSAQIYEQHAQ